MYKSNDKQVHEYQSELSALLIIFKNESQWIVICQRIG